jgi:CubicO group peptidase (beta-lactamase class C family)
MVTTVQTATLAARPTQQESPLRHSEPLEAIIADLEGFIPEYMRDQDIPGVAIALIRDGEMVWREGFGVANAFTNQPIRPDTLFEVASNSKIVTAYIALRLVDQGLLSLDEPLSGYLPEPWLPASEYSDTITLRHALSHSSGLGATGVSEHYRFVPGRGYYYSGYGYGYVQAVIEQVTGQSLEQIAQEIVFASLGMSSSSFVNRAELRPRTANGHLRAIVPALLFTILYLASLLVVGLIGVLILRIRTGRWRPARGQVIGALATAFLLTILIAFVLFGLINFTEFAWLIALCGLILAAAFAGSFLIGRAIIARLPLKRRGLQTALTIVWSALILVALLFLAGNAENLPVPKWPQTEADGGGSMRATAADMAALLIELSEPQHLSPETATQMQTSQVILSSDLSWGLGSGIQHGQQGYALWQWGQHIDFQSIMIIYPEHDFGVVVLTNKDFLSADVAVEIAHRALGGEIESIRRAINLEFNYE